MRLTRKLQLTLKAAINAESVRTVLTLKALANSSAGLLQPRDCKNAIRDFSQL
jgi:hypothetical protein